jgi:YNFM family putative membrane transporter
MRVLAAGGFVSGVTIRLAEPMLPKVAEDFGVNVADAAILLTGFAFAYGFFQLAHGRISDRFGVLRTVAVAMALAAVATGACAFATDLDSLALYRFATGMTAGAIIPLSFAYVGDHVPFEERQPVLGRFIGGILIGQMMGPVIGGILSDSLGWRVTFVFPAIAYGLIALILAPAAIRARRAPRTGESVGFFKAYATLIRRPKVQAVCGAVALEGLLFYGAFGFLGAYLREAYGLSYTAIGLVMAGFGLGGIIYSATVRQMVAQLGIGPMVLIAGILLALFMPALVLVESVALVGGAVLILGFAFYALHNTLQTRATEMAPDSRGTAVAFFAFALFVGQAIGIELAARAVAVGWFAPVFVVAGIGLGILAFWLSRRIDRI